MRAGPALPGGSTCRSLRVPRGNGAAMALTDAGGSCCRAAGVGGHCPGGAHGAGTGAVCEGTAAHRDLRTGARSCVNGSWGISGLSSTPQSGRCHFPVGPFRGHKYPASPLVRPDTQQRKAQELCFCLALLGVPVHWALLSPPPAPAMLRSADGPGCPCSQQEEGLSLQLSSPVGQAAGELGSMVSRLETEARPAVPTSVSRGAAGPL